MSLNICSIDIGKKNFSFCVEKVNPEKLKKIRNIPETKRYEANGLATKEMQKILKDICMNGEIVLHENCDLTQNCDAKKLLDPETYHNMIDCLDNYMEFWDTCDVFVIEEQMKNNTMATKLAQHCYSYFLIKYGRMKTVLYFPSYFKTKILGAPKIEGKPYKSGKKRWKAMQKTQRKKWAIQEAMRIFEMRKENTALEKIQKARKKDDLADTFLMGKAFQYRVYIDKKSF